MHPSALLLMILLAAAVTGEVHGAHPAADTPAGRFWEEALSGAPLPEAIADLIQKGIERSPLKETYYSAAIDLLGPGQQAYQQAYKRNHTHGTPPRGFFFNEEEVARVGSITSVYFAPATTTPILPRDVVEKLPFGNVKDILAMFDMTPASAEAVAETLRGCQDRSLMPGEQKACATSLEGTVRAAARMLGATGGTRVWAVASAVPRDGLPRQRYVVTQVTQLPGDHHVGCHDMTFPYAVYHCHMLAQRTRAYMMAIRGLDGPETDPEVAMVGICHLDTSGWNPDHPAFKMLGTKPGGAPVCHFLPYANLLFGKTMMDDTA